MSHFLLNIYQVSLFLLFVIIFIKYVFPKIKQYLDDIVMLQINEYRNLLETLDKTRNKLLEARKKQRTLEIDLSFYISHKHQKLLELYKSMQQEQEAKLMSYAKTQSRLVKQEYIDNIMQTLQNRICNMLENKSDNISHNIDNCLDAMQQYSVYQSISSSNRSNIDIDHQK